MGDSFRLLLVADSISDAKLMQMMLSRSSQGACEVHWVETLSQALTFLRNEPCDLVLLDLALHGTPDLAPLIALHEAYPQGPVVVFCAYGDRELATSALNAGAQDYLIKGQISPELLSRVLPHSIEIVRLKRMYAECTGALERTVSRRTADLHIRYDQVQAVLESVAEGIAIVDRTGPIQYLNHAAEAWFSYFTMPADTVALRSAISDLVLSADSRPEQMLSLAGIDLLLRAAPLSNAGNGNGSVVVTVQDVSYLRDNDRMKSRFISDVSRELRTPLMTLKVCLELIRKRPDQVEHYLGLLDLEIEHQVMLIEQILELSGLDAGHLALSLQRVDLNTFIGEAVLGYDSEAERRNIRLLFRPSPSRAWAYVDRERINSALASLLRNALQYTPEQGLVMVSIDHEAAGDSQWTTVCVADTGVGISDHELPRIFDRFYRGEQAQVLQIHGAGLGLALVREIVRLHGGRVRVDSRVGKGSTFTLWFPASESPVEPRLALTPAEVNKP